MSQIAVEGMEFFAYHGCFQEEQIIGTRFLIDIHLETATLAAEYSDNLNDTVNYQSVYLKVKEEMSENSKLLEHVARRIVNRLFRDFTSVDGIFIKVSKLNPPVGGKVGSVSVSFSETREANSRQHPLS